MLFSVKILLRLGSNAAHVIRSYTSRQSVGVTRNCSKTLVYYFLQLQAKRSQEKTSNWLICQAVFGHRHIVRLLSVVDWHVNIYIWRVHHLSTHHFICSSLSQLIPIMVELARDSRQSVEMGWAKFQSQYYHVIRACASQHTGNDDRTQISRYYKVHIFAGMSTAISHYSLGLVSLGLDSLRLVSLEPDRLRLDALRTACCTAYFLECISSLWRSHMVSLPL